MDDKELVWVPKSLAEKLNSLDDDLKSGELVLQYIKDTKRDVETSIDALDDDILNLKSFSAKVKKEFKQIYEAQIEESEKLFLDADEKLPHVKDIAGKYISALAPVTEELQKLRELQLSINTWDIERVHDLLASVNKMLSNDRMKHMLEFLIENFSRKVE